MKRRFSREIAVGSVKIGGENPIAVQSMLNVPAQDVDGSVRQAQALERTGCQMIRAAVPDMDAVRLIAALKEHTAMPVVADIHFDYRLALECAAAGVDKIRINPGNIGDAARVKAVADCCREKKIPIRIGVNSGSLEKEILQKHGGPTAAALVESALGHAALLEQNDFREIVLSLKSSNVPRMVEAYDLAAKACDYPLHLGVTEAGTLHSGTIKSAVGIGALLLRGIGDTIRVSLSDDPLHEIRAAYGILQAAGLHDNRPELIACPTCGRTKIDLVSLAKAVEERLANCRKPIQVAVMGCVVNGPGEAREADIGIAGGDGCAVLFRRGEIIKKVAENEILDELMREIEKM